MDPLVCFVFDGSGSMAAYFDSIRKQVLAMMNKRPDTITIVFSTNSLLCSEQNYVLNIKDQDRIPFLNSNTNIEGGFQLMCSVLQDQNKNGREVHIVFITDGQDDNRDTINVRLAELPKLEMPTRLFVLGVGDFPTRTIANPLEMNYSTLEGRTYPLVIPIKSVEEVKPAFERLERALKNPTERPGSEWDIKAATSTSQLRYWAELAADEAIGKLMSVLGLPKEYVLGSCSPEFKDAVQTKGRLDEVAINEARGYVGRCIRAARAIVDASASTGTTKMERKLQTLEGRQDLEHMEGMHVRLTEARRNARVMGTLVRNIDVGLLGQLMSTTVKYKAAALWCNKGIKTSSFESTLVEYIEEYTPNDADECAYTSEGGTVADAWLDLQMLHREGKLPPISDTATAMITLPIRGRTFVASKCAGTTFDSYKIDIISDLETSVSAMLCESDEDDLPWFEDETYSMHCPPPPRDGKTTVTYLHPPAFKSHVPYFFRALATYGVTGDKDLCHHESYWAVSAAVAAHLLRTGPLDDCRLELAEVADNLEAVCPPADYRHTYSYVQQLSVEGFGWMCLLPSIDRDKATEAMLAASLGVDYKGKPCVDHLKCESLNKFVLALMLGITRPERFGVPTREEQRHLYMGPMTPAALRELYMRFLVAVAHAGKPVEGFMGCQPHPEAVRDFKLNLPGEVVDRLHYPIACATKEEAAKWMRAALGAAMRDHGWEIYAEPKFDAAKLDEIRVGQWTVDRARQAFANLAQLADIDPGCLDLRSEQYQLVIDAAKIADNVQRCSASMEVTAEYREGLQKRARRAAAQSLVEELVQNMSDRFAAQFAERHKEIVAVGESDLELLVLDGCLTPGQKARLLESLLPRCCLSPACPHFLKPFANAAVLKNHIHQQPIVRGLHKEVRSMLLDVAAQQVQMASLPLTDARELSTRCLRDFVANDGQFSASTWWVGASRVVAALHVIYNGMNLCPSPVLGELKQKVEAALQDRKTEEDYKRCGQAQAALQEFVAKGVARSRGAVQFHADAAKQRPYVWIAAAMQRIIEQMAERSVCHDPSVRQALAAMCGSQGQ